MKRFTLLLSLLLACPAGAAQASFDGIARATIMQIQGTGQFSPLQRQIVESSGVVTLVTAKRDGFWIQDPAGDGDPATSDGVFVAGIPGIAVPAAGDEVRILGRVEEEQRGNELPRTRLFAVQNPEVLSKGNQLPPPVNLTKLPDVSIAEGIAFWEALEGMRVRVESAPVISPTNRFREFTVLASGNAVAGSGYFPESGRLLVRTLDGDQVDYNPERILIGDATLQQPVVVSAGDRVVSLTGVADYTFHYYKIQPDPAAVRVETRELPPSPVSSRSGETGNLIVTTYNLWDLFNSIPKGKNAPHVLAPDKLETRLAKIAHSVVGELRLPHVIAVNEAEGSAMELLAERINRLAGTRYQAAWLETSDWRGLSIGFLYDAARLKLENLSQLSGAAAEMGAAFGQNAAMGSREPLVGVFSLGLGIPPVTVIANKLKTKRAEDSPFSLEPPFRFTEIQRKAQVRLIRRYLDSIFAGDPEAYVVVTGDLGDYPFPEPGEGLDHPLGILEGTEGEVPMVNLVNRIPEAERFDYLFQGGGVVVSHALVSPALLKRFVGADFLHFNTPFPDQLKWEAGTQLKASDRDPLEVRFDLGPHKP